MRLIEAGVIHNGIKMELSARHEDETPHNVTLTKNYFIGVYEITQKNWFDVIGKRPSFFKDCDDCPVEKYLGVIRYILQINYRFYLIWNRYIHCPKGIMPRPQSRV